MPFAHDIALTTPYPMMILGFAHYLFFAYNLLCFLILTINLKHQSYLAI
jgi:hypothetical protein